jgi:hypothetical protein
MNQSTPLAIAAHTHPWPADSGAVPNARLRHRRCTTFTCSVLDSANTAHIQRFENTVRHDGRAGPSLVYVAIQTMPQISL